MELQLVSCEQAKALKELGFPQDLFYGTFYFATLESVNPIPFCGMPFTNTHIVCPTLELAAKWLREKKDLWIHICKPNSDLTKWSSSVNRISSHLWRICLEFDSYEQALSAGIDKAIEILKSKS